MGGEGGGELWRVLLVLGAVVGRLLLLFAAAAVATAAVATAAMAVAADVEVSVGLLVEVVAPGGCCCVAVYRSLLLIVLNPCHRF